MSVEERIRDARTALDSLEARAEYVDESTLLGICSDLQDEVEAAREAEAEAEAEAEDESESSDDDEE